MHYVAERALQEIDEVARGFGIRPSDPEVLQASSFSVVVRLRPYRIIAKATGDPAQWHALEKELAVALHLKERGAPTTRPVEDTIPPELHKGNGLGWAMTFW